MTTGAPRMARVLPLAEGRQVCEGASCGDASVGDAVVGAVLRAARERAGISPAQAAAYAGLRESRIMRLEAARATWAPEHAVALARRYGMPPREVEELGHLLVAGHHHALPDYGAICGTRLGALESQAVRIPVAAQTVPPFFYGWARPGAGGSPADELRPWPGCPVTLIWDDLTLGRGYVDAPRTAARLRHLTAMVDAEVLTFRLLIPDYSVGFEPVGSELTFAGTGALCVSEELSVVAYSNGPRAREKSALLDRQLAAALSPKESAAALRRAAERWAGA
ncbi:helix-turn-helix domain-containing protein [Streptomyces longwoodensis]|uniref:helix-turn-helix domain-containing protein n=1 Tax=Streptomyces longwoodensis TaxID=68231 RepID=UPI00384BD48E